MANPLIEKYNEIHGQKTIQSQLKFNHINVDLPKLERQTIDGVRYYNVPNGDQLIKMVSITSVTSHFNKEIFIKWRKRVGNEEAEKNYQGCNESRNGSSYSSRELSL